MTSFYEKRMNLHRKLTRCKRDDPSSVLNDSQLARVLTTFDLVALGVGSTMGVGIYVLAGGVAKDIAGPAVVISFLLAAVVTAFAGLSFAEFGARVPKAGSAYIYSYYTMGELVAFVIGWSLILEYSIGAASVAKGISSYTDSLTNHFLSDAFTAVAPLQGSFLSSYVDFFAMSLCLFLSIGMALGVKDSSLVNRLFTSCNVLVVIFFIVSASLLADPHNWNIDKSEIPEGVKGGEGGFFPFGIAGVIQGAAICFYGFVGFDAIATTGEEVKNPQRAIPVSIVTSLIIVLTAYFGVSAVITLMVPYYMQDRDAPIPYAFDLVGWTIPKWIVGVGALFGLLASLFGALFPLPRIIYAMASDGLLYRSLGRVHPRYKTPMIGTIVSGILTSLLAAVFNLQQLVGLNAIGTLLTYTLVSICVVILRFQDCLSGKTASAEYTPLLKDPKGRTPVTFIALCRQFFNTNKLTTPTLVTSKLVSLEMFVFCLLSVGLSIAVVNLSDDISMGEVVTLVSISTLLFIMIIILFSMSLQPTSSQSISFKMPCVPLLPCLSIIFNVYLMVVLDVHTWIRFLAVMSVGFFIYFSYGIHHSRENQTDSLSMDNSDYSTPSTVPMTDT